MNLKLADKKLGYVLNFGEALMKDGIVDGVAKSLKPTPMVIPVQTGIQCF